MNIDLDPVDLAGWTLTDERTADTYTFPSFTLASGKYVIVRTGRGTNSATDLYWSGGPDHAATSNSDDVVTLRNTTGTRIADSRGFVLGAPTLPTLIRTPVTTMPLVTMVTLPGHTPVSPIPTPYITTPPAGAPLYGPYGPIAPPYPTYPTTIQTLAPGQTTVPTTLPTVPMPYQHSPIALPTGVQRPVLLPTVAPASPIGLGSIAPGVKSLPGAKRYAIGNPGSLLGTRFGMGGWTTPTGTVRTVSTTGNDLKPGNVAFGIAPPSSGSFVRWYPAARWAAGLK